MFLDPLSRIKWLYQNIEKIIHHNQVSVVVLSDLWLYDSISSPWKTISAGLNAPIMKIKGLASIFLNR
jgi:hypothetical protein